MRPRVMIIDDDPTFRNLLLTTLRKDFVVSVAGDGAEGFQKAIEHVPDGVIIDVMMPNWDGLKTLRAFRAHPQLKSVPIMMLTGDASKETVLAAIHAGASDYFIKLGFQRHEFLRKLARLLNIPAHRLLESIDEAAAAEQQSATPALSGSRGANGSSAVPMTHLGGPSRAAATSPAATVAPEPTKAPRVEPAAAAPTFDSSALQAVMDNWE